MDLVRSCQEVGGRLLVDGDCWWWRVVLSDDFPRLCLDVATCLCELLR